jgi:hypothetical protein
MLVLELAFEYQEFFSQIVLVATEAGFGRIAHEAGSASNFITIAFRYGAMLTDLSLPALEVWRLYRGRADCENRIKELKADFGLDSFVLRDFWATEAALGVTMLSYNLMSVFRHAVMRQKVHHTLSTLHHQVLAVGALWDDSTRNIKQTFRLAVARKRRPWFDGLWANAGEPVKLTPVRSNS